MMIFSRIGQAALRVLCAAGLVSGSFGIAKAQSAGTAKIPEAKRTTSAPSPTATRNTLTVTGSSFGNARVGKRSAGGTVVTLTGSNFGSPRVGKRGASGDAGKRTATPNQGTAKPTATLPKR